MRPVPSKADHDVAYVTDVEGMWTRLESFCADNDVVRFDADGRLIVREGATFVFGGDAIDRGPWSRRIVRTLLEAKLRQPEQVVMLAGNRDLNKLRLARELTGFPTRRAPEDVQKGPRAALLKWIMTNTMGAAEAFEFRRTELSVEREQSIDDEEVAQSYVDDLAPSGELARYLAQCQLAWRSGKTLFVHGGLAEEALTVVPRTPTTALQALDVDKWAERLERFYDQQMAAFTAREIEPDGTPAWEDAILYQAPRKGMRSNPGSVVYGRNADDLNNPLLPSKDVVDALVRSGINRVVVGHTPSGDTPSIVRVDVGNATFEHINCDNSRSRVLTGTKTFIRDAAVVVRGNVVLDDKSQHTLSLTLHADDKKTPIGRRTSKDGDVVKGPLDDGWLLFRYLPAYQVTQTVTRDLGTLEDAVEPPPDVPATTTTTTTTAAATTTKT